MGNMNKAFHREAFDDATLLKLEIFRNYEKRDKKLKRKNDMSDYFFILKPVMIAIGIAVILGIAIKVLEKFLIKLFSKK